MLLILPNDKDGLSKTELKLEKVDIADIMTEMQEEMLEVTIPKFTIETTVQLNNILQRVRPVHDLFLTEISQKTE